MGDENNLSGTTKAHKHSALSSDGGFLETTVTGITNLSEGSIVYGDSSEIVTELNAGTTGDTLVMGSSVPEWGSAGGVTTNIQIDSLSADFSTTSTTPVSIGLSLTCTNSSGGLCNIAVTGTWWSEPTDYNAYTQLYNDGVAVSNSVRFTELGSTSQRIGYPFVWAVATDGSVLDIRAYVESGTTVNFDGSTGDTNMVLSEIY